MKTYTYKGYHIAHQQIHAGDITISHWTVSNPSIPGDFPLVGYSTIREAKSWINYRLSLFKN